MGSRTVYAVLLVIFLSPRYANAQATANSTAAVSRTGVTYGVMAGTASSATPPQGQSKSPHIADPGGPSADELNRKALEPRAGSSGGELLLRSLPDRAQVFVNGAYVGRTPLLLIVAPGKYNIEMRGQRESTGKRTVELAAKETQEIGLTLTPRYPNHVATR